MKVLNDDGETLLEMVEDLESVLGVTELKDKLVGVRASLSESADSGRAGTGVKGGRRCLGTTDETAVGDGGIVLIRSIDDGDPLGRRKEVSYDASATSCNANDMTLGVGCKIDESYDRSVDEAHCCGLRGGGLDDVPLMVDKSNGEERVDSEILKEDPAIVEGSAGTTAGGGDGE
jgi:hypothetical protein